MFCCNQHSSHTDTYTRSQFIQTSSHCIHVDNVAFLQLNSYICNDGFVPFYSFLSLSCTVSLSVTCMHYFKISYCHHYSLKYALMPETKTKCSSNWGRTVISVQSESYQKAGSQHHYLLICCLTVFVSIIYMYPFFYIKPFLHWMHSLLLAFGPSRMTVWLANSQPCDDHKGGNWKSIRTTVSIQWWKNDRCPHVGMHLSHKQMLKVRLHVSVPISVH